MTDRLPVECGGCGWESKRLPGEPVQCLKCGAFASFQEPTYTRMNRNVFL